jgi:hypothetical protein
MVKEMVPLKVSALASGVILLEGKPVGLDGLEQALRETRKNNGIVWYYEEPPQSGRAAGGTPVIGLILKYALPVSLTTTPDFANRLAIGVGRQAAAVKSLPEVESVFTRARRIAAGVAGLNCVVTVRPDRQLLLLPTPQSVPALPSRDAGLGTLIPPEVKRAIAVIAETDFAMGSPETNEVPSLTTAGRAIPFLGLLMALSHAGHAVWIFNGDVPDLAAGCRGADALIVDGNILAQLRQGWEKEAAAAMRNPNILVHDPRSYQLRMVRKAGEGEHTLEFPN